MPAIIYSLFCLLKITALRNHLFRWAFLVSLLIVFNVLSAQQKNTAVIKGRAITTGNTPASFATIILKRNGKKISADADGFFEIDNLPPLHDTLVISAVGTHTYTYSVAITNGQVLNLGTIITGADAGVLQDVEITGRLERSYKSDYSYAPLKTKTALINTPQSVSTVTKELMQDKMEFSLQQAIENVAGANQYSGYDEFTIRGFRAENPHLINGLRSYNTTLITPMLVNIERLEVIKGLVSVLYANADPGGTINLVTKKPLDTKEAGIELYGGSWNNLRAQGDITGPLNTSKDLLYRFNAGYSNTNSFRDHYFSKSWQVAPSLSYIPNNKLQLNADFSIAHTNTLADRGQPGIYGNNDLTNTPISLTVSQPGDNLTETDIASVISFSYKLNNHITLNSAYLNYITNQQLQEHGIKDYITPDSVYLYYTQKTFSTITNTFTNFATFDFNTGNIRHRLLTGYDFINSSVKLDVFNGELPDEFGEGSGIVGTFSLLHPQYQYRNVKAYKESDEPSDNNADAYTTQGLYVQEQMDYKKWSLLLSLRGEFYKEGGDDDDDNGDTGVAGSHINTVLPRIAIMYTVKPDINLYATYNKGFDPFEINIMRQVFNQALKPIFSSLYETGIKAGMLRNKLMATLSVYQLTLNNVAVNANDPDNPDLYVQRGKEQATGAEAEVNGNILPGLNITLSYAYNVTKIKESTVPAEVGTIKENAPQNSSGSWIKYTFNKGWLKKLSLSAGHSQVGIRNTLTPGLQLPAYCIADAGIGYSYKKFGIAFNVFNIANTTYWTSGYNYSSKWPGAPRSCMLNIAYRFSR